MNRTLHHTLLSTMLGGLALSTVAFAGGAGMFMKADADNDGRVSAREHAAAAQARFAAMDANRDGSLAAAELAASRGMRDGKRGHGMQKMHAGMMARMDADRDGAITRAEHATASQAMFDRMDANRDGRVTAEEMKAGHAKMMAGHGGMQHEGKHHEGMKHEGMKHEGMRHHDGKDMHGHGMARMDANGDGRVTAAEHAAAAQAMFLRMDADRDGFVSKAEMQAGHGMKKDGMRK